MGFEPMRLAPVVLKTTPFTARSNFSNRFSIIFNRNHPRSNAKSARIYYCCWREEGVYGIGFPLHFQYPKQYKILESDEMLEKFRNKRLPLLVDLDVVLGALCLPPRESDLASEH